MLFKGKSFIIYIAGEYIEVFGVKNAQKNRFYYPDELVHYGEIVDEVKFQEAFSRFLNPLIFDSRKGIIFLAQKLVFSGEIESTNVQSEKIDTFLPFIPLPKENVSIVLHDDKGKRTIFATNRKLFEAIIGLLEQKKLKVFCVFPVSASAYKPPTQELTLEDMKEYIKESKRIQQCNFLRDETNTKKYHTLNKDDDFSTYGEKSKNMKNQYILFCICLLCFASSIIYLLLWSNVIENSWFGDPSHVISTIPSATDTRIVASKERSIEEPLDKSKISIQVLNGSRIEGQAGKMSQILKDEGYSNVDVGNAPEAASESSLIYDTSLSTGVIDMVTTFLKKYLTDVNITEATQSAERDVVITIGSGQ